MSTEAAARMGGRSWIGEGQSVRGQCAINLAVVLAIATAVRLLFYPGVLGSDEITYTAGAVKLLTGGSVSTTYIGAMRYGVDMPVAFFLWLFGPSESAAAVWAMLTSVLDVAFIYACAWILWGHRAALLAGAVVAFLPLHVALAGRLLADPPLAAFITLSLLCFLIGERGNRAAWFFGAGLAVGGVFWIKQSVVAYALVFPVYAIAAQRWNTKWLWGAAGALLMLAINCLVMWRLQGDPFHVFSVTGRGLGEYSERADINDSAWLYFKYLLLDVRHTWILAYLAIAGAVYGATVRARSREENPVFFVGLWAVCLLVLFSFAVISWNPVRLIMKQSNYMLIFTAPLCLLAGYGLSRMPSRIGVPLLGIYVIGGGMLAALHQQDIRSFTANSREAVAFAKKHPDAVVYATANAHRHALFDATVSPVPGGRPVIRPLDDLEEGRGEKPANPSAGEARSPTRLAIIDVHTMQWAADAIGSVDEIPKCFRPIGPLDGVRIEGAGRYAVNALMLGVRILPGSLGAPIAGKLSALAAPKPALLFEVPEGCTLPARPGGGA